MSGTVPALSGMFAAVVTPFDVDGGVDVDGITRQVEHVLSGGVDGIVACGTSGEFTQLSHEERCLVNRHYIRGVDGRVPVVAGTGALATEETVALTRAAVDDGADAVMVVPPFYDLPSFPELLRHYGTVSEAVDVGIMYYNVPVNSGISLTAEQFGILGQRTNVSWVKDTGGDMVLFTELQMTRRSDVGAFCGFDSLAFGALALGAPGCVLGAASLLPAQFRDLHDAFRRDDLAEARRLWSLLHPVCAFLEAGEYVVSLRKGLDILGVGAGRPRRDLPDMTPTDEDVLRGLLADAGARTTG